MRFVLVVGAAVFSIACHKYEFTPAPDAPRSLDARSVVDATLDYCHAAAGTASVTTDDHGTLQLWSRLDAGGVWAIGPVAPVAGAPMSVSLLFTNVDPLDGNTGGCCQSPGSSCCAIDGVLATNDSLPSGGELGMHPLTFKSLQNASFSISGTMTITDFVQPFETAPGRIAGSVSAQAGAQSVYGTFDNSFCAALLSATI
jgi:hypothetical protein